MKHSFPMRTLSSILYYIVIGLILFLTLSCSRESDVCHLKLKLSNLSSGDSVLVLRLEGGGSFSTEEIRVTPPKARIRHKVKGDVNRILLYFNEGNNVLRLYPERGEDLTITLDADQPLLPKIKGGSTHATLNEFMQTADDEIRSYQDHLRTTDFPSKAEAFADLRLKALRFYLSHSDAPGINRLVEEYDLFDAAFVRRSGISMHRLPAPLDSVLRKNESYAIGRLAPDFLVKDIDQRSFTLSWYKGQDVLLHFANKPDSATVACLKAWKNKTGMKKPEVLTLALFAPDSSLRKLTAGLAMPLRVVSDSVGQVSTLLERYGIDSLPYTVHIDTAGYIRSRHAGHSLP
ncbi:antioxidant, AhpC/TSA family protein [Porphyromonas sp. COT-052 OH4946]|uniref:TlpA family protein disulfide reductase n=1 Tax=Porphyromonas sp. COT-052 OH4946 TaxID=1515618 RepID=UPI00051D55CF|nr:antioxidant, AhpC/TSA family protein [Porphyromonas sp. COT-052 OH4946]